ncbi:hypothetical protein SLE2022_219050 [Rubroshorea leprosula]
MEIYSSFQDFEGMNTEGSHECQGIDEDDVFYAEIRRQILLLTADEDDDDRQERTYPRGSNRVIGAVSSGVRAPGSYFTWGENEKSDSVPTWLVNLWKSSNGTGVFIPNIVRSRRRNRHERMNNGRQRIYKPVQSKQP